MQKGNVYAESNRSRELTQNKPVHETGTTADYDSQLIIISLSFVSKEELSHPLREIL